MSPSRLYDRSTLAVERFDPQPGTLYSLDITAHIAGVSRRAVLLYCKAELIQPVIEPSFGALLFDDEAIHAIRQIECLREVHGVNLTGVRMIFELMKELDRLRSEVRFLRGQ